MMMNGERPFDMANALLFLSRSNYKNAATIKRVFVCKTCKKEFSSFQALGGHRASHKKPAADLNGVPNAAAQPKNMTHECSICGAAFPIGQALGGHMRRHRNILLTNSAAGGGRKETAAMALGLLPAPVMMKKTSGNSNSKRVLCLDLNLTPLENDDLKLEL